MALQLDRATMEAALVGYQRQIEEIQTKMAELRRRLGAAARRPPPQLPPRRPAKGPPGGSTAMTRARAARPLGEVQEGFRVGHLLAVRCFGCQFQLVVRLIQEVLRLLRVALHIELVSPLCGRDLLPRLSGEPLRRGDTGMPPRGDII